MEDGEGQHRRAQAVAELVREHAEALGTLVGDGLVASALVLGDGVGDGVVEAAIQGVKLVCGDGRVGLVGELGDDLTDIAVAVDHLAHAEAHRQHLAAVQRGALFDDPGVGGGDAQPVDELAQEERHAILQLGLGRHRRRPRGDLGARAIDDRLGVRREELVKHRATYAGGLVSERTAWEIGGCRYDRYLQRPRDLLCDSRGRVASTRAVQQVPRGRATRQRLRGTVLRARPRRPRSPRPREGWRRAVD